MTLTCEVCEQDTDCRIGYSNRTIQPLSFACPHCGSLLKITLDISHAPKSIFRYKSCHPSDNQPTKPFDGTNPFVDLHLDFPVRFGKYVMGNTPFLMAMQDLQDSAGDDSDLAFQMIQFHNQRLNQLNYFHDKADLIKSIIRLYSGKNKQLFKKRVGDFLESDEGLSLNPEDINATLYKFLSFVFLPFVNFREVKDIVKGFTELTMRLHGEPFIGFVDKLVSSGFLKELQTDCLKLYPEIYNAEMPMRAALYLDLTDKFGNSKTAARISTKDFLTYKDLYKDLIEVFARQLVLVAGINNIIHRGNSDSFKSIDGGALSSLEKYSEKTLSQRLKYLDDCWYQIDNDVINAGVRNAIAHNNVQYNEITQVITYFPNGGGLSQTESNTLIFLDFMRMILLLFREIHNLHHLIKCIYYYEYLIKNKSDAST